MGKITIDKGKTMYNSTDPEIRIRQARLRSYGTRKKTMEEFHTKTLEELLTLKEKGEQWISKAMAEFLERSDEEFEKKFDQTVERYEALVDVITIKQAKKTI